MSTSVHVLLRDPAGLEPLRTAPQGVLDLFMRHGQYPKYSAGRLETQPPSPDVAQFNLRGKDQVAVGKTLLHELELMGFQARLYFHNRSTGTGVWWPTSPDWPTWEWPAERVSEWLRRQP